MTSGRWSGRVPCSASHRRRQLRASRARGAIARARTVVVASAASARLKVLDAMPRIGASHVAVGPLPHVHPAWIPSTRGGLQAPRANANASNMARMDEWQSDHWRGTPCTSDAWPYSPDIAVFEARRAIGQLVRTFGDGVNPLGPEASDVDPVLRYIRAAHDLETIMGVVRGDLVAEARARGLAWEMIGRALGVGRTAAHNRFGSGLPDERLEQLKVEAMVSWTARQAARPHQLPEDVAKDLADASPLDRLEYLARNALRTVAEVDQLLASAESDPENALGVLRNACRRIERVLKAVAVDHAMWDAMAGWYGRPGTVDQANYYAPTTYLQHAMRLLVFALLHAPDENSTDGDDFRAFLAVVKRVYAMVLLILGRPDVGSAVPSPGT